jgi:hypothetical protein
VSDACFWSFFQADWYRSVYESKKKPIVSMQWTNWAFIKTEKNTFLSFAEVIATCECHEIKDIMQLKYDCNDEVIL